MIGPVPVTFRPACIIGPALRLRRSCPLHHAYLDTWGDQPRFFAPMLQKVCGPQACTWTRISNVTHKWPAWRVPMSPIGNPSPYSPSTPMKTSPNSRRAVTLTSPAHHPSISLSNNRLPRRNHLPSFGVTCGSVCTHKSKAVFAEGTRDSGTRFASVLVLLPPNW